MVAVNYVWDPFTDNVIKEMDDAGNVIASYNSKPELHGDLISQKRDGTTSCYHYDGQGSLMDYGIPGTMTRRSFSGLRKSKTEERKKGRSVLIPCRKPVLGNRT